MRSGLLLSIGAVMIVAGCQSVHRQTADSIPVEPAVFSSEESDLAIALAAFMQGLILEGELGRATPESRALLEIAREHALGSHTILSRISLDSFQQQDFDGAIATFEESLSASPDDPVRQVDLAAMYLLAGRQTEAKPLLRKSLDTVPTNTSNYITLSRIHFNQGEDTEAIALMEDAFTKVPNPEIIRDFLLARARQFVSRGELDRSIPVYELIAQWNEEERAELRYYIAELYLAHDRKPEALTVFYDVVEIPNAPSVAFLRLAALLIDEGFQDEAIRILGNGMQAFPQEAAFPFFLGGLHAGNDHWEKALIAYQEAVQIITAHAGDTPIPRGPSDKNILIATAHVLERLQRHDEAEAILQQILAAFPESHIAMNFLAYMWAERNMNIEEAYRLSQASLEHDPDNGAYIDTLGWIYYRMHNLEKALEYLQRANDIMGPDPEILLHLGDVHHTMGNSQQAVAYWQASVAEDASPQNRAQEQLKNAMSQTPAEINDIPAADEPTQDDTTIPEPQTGDMP